MRHCSPKFSGCVSEGTDGWIAVVDLLERRQWTERFAVRVEGQRVRIPARLRFEGDRIVPDRRDDGSFVRALQTRGNDGFERQRAARDLLVGLPPWAAPFILALTREDIVDAMTPEAAHALGTFVMDNQAYRQTTKRRVASYRSACYRYPPYSECRRPIGREHIAVPADRQDRSRSMQRSLPSL